MVCLLASKVDVNIAQTNKEDFHNFLCSSSNIFTRNIMDYKDDTYRKFCKLRNNHDIVVLASDKESISIVMNKKDYTDKVDRLISEGIYNKKYCATEDTTLKDLKNFQSFLYKDFKDHKDYKDIYPSSHQP